MSLIVMAKRALIAAAVAVCTHPVIAQSIDLDKPLIIAKQGSFFAGGRDIESDTLSTLPQAEPKGTVTVEQMYVQYQVPVHANSASVVFIHGCCLTGAEWETTPDGRTGWAEYFRSSKRPSSGCTEIRIC
ncbi:carboxylesterase [Paraburkholderia xenovorans LB400]|uniref:Uncharacterized protein n=1 Tax=Paraburkholderia xenovorans (strain LB400) TaxID=266265 RepID=Q13M70_PARXL|nr:hypothetical protein [Paraburkholderia xenovorans]ABE34819.1 hypothetical protein Bxe_B1137 [Paraburkholderia xenovorans LB400]AIP37965.1 carboxylesterase [Paraburkholderia xenovorans LB400]